MVGMVGKGHHQMIVMLVTATEVAVVEFQGVPTTGVCLHDSYVILIPHFLCACS